MKRILIAVLSLAVLFGFAACEDGSSSNTSGMIAGATVTGGEKVYIPGETVDLSDYTFSLTMADGSTQPASASDFVFDSLVVPYGAARSTEISGKYKGMANAGVKLPVNVASVTKLDITGTPAIKTYYTPIVQSSDADNYKKYTDGLIDLEGITVEATYVDKDNVEGKKNVALDNEYLFATVTAKGTAWTPDDNDNDNVVTVYFADKEKDSSDLTSFNAKDTFDITVKKNLVTSIELKATEDYTIYVGSTTKGTLAYAADDSTAGVYVEATYQNGETAKVTNDMQSITGGAKVALKFGTASNAISTAYADLDDLTPSKVEATELYVQVDNLDAVAGFVKTTSLPLDVVENSETKLKVEATAGFKVGDYRTLEESAFKALFTVKTVLADGTDGSTIPAAEYTIVAPTSTNRDFSKMSANDRVLVSVSAVRNGVTLTGEAQLQLKAQ